MKFASDEDALEVEYEVLPQLIPLPPPRSEKHGWQREPPQPTRPTPPPDYAPSSSVAAGTPPAQSPVFRQVTESSPAIDRLVAIQMERDMAAADGLTFMAAIGKAIADPLVRRRYEANLGLDAEQYLQYLHQLTTVRAANVIIDEKMRAMMPRPPRRALWGVSE